MERDVHGSNCSGPLGTPFRGEIPAAPPRPEFRRPENNRRLGSPGDGDGGGGGGGGGDGGGGGVLREPSLYFVDAGYVSLTFHLPRTPEATARADAETRLSYRLRKVSTGVCRM